MWVGLYPMSSVSPLYMLCGFVTIWRAYWGGLRNAAIATVLIAVCVAIYA